MMAHVLIQSSEFASATTFTSDGYHKNRKLWFLLIYFNVFCLPSHLWLENEIVKEFIVDIVFP